MSYLHAYTTHEVGEEEGRHLPSGLVLFLIGIWQFASLYLFATSVVKGGGGGGAPFSSFSSPSPSPLLLICRSRVFSPSPLPSPTTPVLPVSRVHDSALCLASGLEKAGSMLDKKLQKKQAMFADMASAIQDKERQVRRRAR